MDRRCRPTVGVDDVPDAGAVRGVPTLLLGAAVARPAGLADGEGNRSGGDGDGARLFDDDHVTALEAERRGAPLQLRERVIGEADALGCAAFRTAAG